MSHLAISSAGRSRSAGGPLRVMVVDDHAIVRQGIATMLELIDGVTVVASAREGYAAIELAVAHEPDVILLDLRMPGLDGVETTRRLRQAAPAAAVVILTSFLDGESVLAALQAGACGYLTKEADIAEIERAVVAAAAGQSLLGVGVRQTLLAVSGPGAVERGAGDLAPRSLPAEAAFTPREREVLRLIARGLSNRQIAEDLVVTEVTVKTHVNRVFSKSGSQNRAQAVRYAFRRGFADT